MTNGAAQEPGRHYFERGAQANAMQSCCRYRAGFTQLPRAHVAVTGPGFHDNLASLFLDKPRTASLLLPLLAPTSHALLRCCCPYSRLCYHYRPGFMVLQNMPCGIDYLLTVCCTPRLYSVFHLGSLMDALLRI